MFLENRFPPGKFNGMKKLWVFWEINIPAYYFHYFSSYALL